MKQNPKALLLVAGEGTRLRPYTQDRPKCLVELEGQSLLEHQLAILKSSGISDVVLVGGYRAEMLEGYGERLVVNNRYNETNMVWTLFCAEHELEDDTIICYGDIVYSRQVLQTLLHTPGDIVTTIDLEWEPYWRARNEDPLIDAETLKINASGMIAEIGQKPKTMNDIEGQYMGLIRLSAIGVLQFKEVFEQAVKKKELGGKPVEKAYMTDLLQAIIDSGYSLTPAFVHGGWIEVDTVRDLENPVTRERLKEVSRV